MTGMAVGIILGTVILVGALVAWGFLGFLAVPLVLVVTAVCVWFDSP